MNIFGVGGWEILVILVITLIVAGPKRMLQWAYYAGRFMGQLRVMWSGLMESIQKDLDASGVDVRLPKNLDRGEISRAAGDFLRPLTDEMRRAEAELRKETSKIESEYKRETEELDSSIKQGFRVDKPAEDKDSKPEPAPRQDLGTWSGTRTDQE